MYLGHFSLREAPFSITPDSDFYYPHEAAQATLNMLLVALRSGEGFLKVVGELGCGKTVLCRHLLKTLQGEFVTAYIPNPDMGPDDLLLALADELGVVVAQPPQRQQIMNAIGACLVQHAAQGKRVLVCIDEAQAIPVRSVESLRLLSNLETEKRKLLQIVLFGQPELNRNLQNDAIRQLAQRITFHYRLEPLTKDDLDFYISHRLSVAGYQGSRLFTRGAVRQLNTCSGGIPRLVNILAHKAMMAAYGEGRREVTARHVKAAAKDTIAAKGSWRWWWLLLPLGTLLAGSGVVWAYLQ